MTTQNNWEKESIIIRAKDYPTDMIYVNGNDSISSFYIGRTEECNRNYLIYLDWLYKVYSADYPEIYKAALPDTSVAINKFHFNDPFNRDYLQDPSFSYYPVVGVSWIQANNYCHWKGDRYNEFILIREGILRFNPDQINENNFNTETYLSDQYEGYVRSDILDPLTNDTTKVLYRYHMLLPVFRLPTEAEWEYAALYNQELKPKSKQIFKNNYFLNKWIGYSDQYSSSENKLNIFRAPIQIKMNNLLSDVRGELPIVHMADNISEWTYDIDFGNNSNREPDLIKDYAKCFQILSDDNDRDEEGVLFEKDSLGMMSIEYLCDDKNGNPVLVKSYRSQKENYLKYNADSILPVKRIFRGGNNTSKGTNKRGSLFENSSSSDLGFRCALTMIKN